MNAYGIKKRFKNQKGSTLLEALIALSAIVIILAATSSVVITSLTNSTFSRDQNQANKLAQQGLEYIREQVGRKTNFDAYSDPVFSSQTHCMVDIAENPDNPFTESVCDSGDNIDGAFRREVEFTPNAIDCNPPDNPDADTLKVTVTVFWQSGKCPVGGVEDNPFCHSQEVSSCFVDPGVIYPTGI